MNITYTIIPGRTIDLQKNQIEDIIYNASRGKKSQLNYKQVKPNKINNTIKEEFIGFTTLPIFDGLSEYVQFFENIIDIPYGINIDNMNISEFNLRRNERKGIKFIDAFGGSEIFIALNLNKLNTKLRANELLSIMSTKEKIKAGSKYSVKKKRRKTKKKKTKKKKTKKNRPKSGNNNIIPDYHIAMQKRPDLFPQYSEAIKRLNYNEINNRNINRKNNFPSMKELDRMRMMKNNYTYN